MINQLLPILLDDGSQRDSNIKLSCVVAAVINTTGNIGNNRKVFTAAAGVLNTSTAMLSMKLLTVCNAVTNFGSPTMVIKLAMSNAVGANLAFTATEKVTRKLASPGPQTTLAFGDATLLNTYLKVSQNVLASMEWAGNFTTLQKVQAVVLGVTNWAGNYAIKRKVFATSASVLAFGSPTLGTKKFIAQVGGGVINLSNIVWVNYFKPRCLVNTNLSFTADMAVKSFARQTVVASLAFGSPTAVKYVKPLAVVPGSMNFGPPTAATNRKLALVAAGVFNINAGIAFKIKTAASVPAVMGGSALATVRRKVNSVVACSVSIGATPVINRKLTSVVPAVVNVPTLTATNTRKSSLTIAAVTNTPNVQISNKRKATTIIAAVMNTVGDFGNKRKVFAVCPASINITASPLFTRKLSSIAAATSSIGATPVVRRKLVSVAAAVFSITVNETIRRKINGTAAGSINITGAFTNKRKVNTRISGSLGLTDNRTETLYGEPWALPARYSEASLAEHS